MSVLLLLLLSSPPAPLHEQAFRLERPSEAVAVIQRVVRALRLGRARPRGGGPRALGRRRPAAARPAGSRQPGASTASCSGRSARRAPARPGARRALVRARDGGRAGRERPASRRWPTDDPGHEALAHAPIVHTRKGSLERFSDAPLVAWVETLPAADGGPRAALLDRVQPRGRRHAARPADGDLGPRDRHRARLRGASSTPRAACARARVPGQGPRHDGVRRAHARAATRCCTSSRRTTC